MPSVRGDGVRRDDAPGNAGEPASGRRRAARDAGDGGKRYDAELWLML